MRVPLRALSPVAMFLLLALLSGCVAEEEEPEELLKASHRIGEELYSWGDHDFTKAYAAGGTRRIRADFEVPPEIDRIGVAFRGSFVWPENSTALFEIKDPEDRRLLLLNASAGQEDDQGTVGSFWTFRPVLPVGPGTYPMVATGTGYVGHLEFQVHGIPGDATSINETFDVRTAGPVELQVFVQGWGRTPTVTLTGPDGVAVDLGIRAPEDDVTHRFDAQEGTYHLDADTTRWAGRFVAQARR